MFALGQNSRSLPLCIKKSAGSWLWDTNGRKYFDAFSSFSSANFGHQHPIIKTAIKRQIDLLSVFSRTMPSDVLLDLSKFIHLHYNKKIVSQQLRFIPMNSGVEAGETAIKIARKWGYVCRSMPKNEAKIIFATNNYWGRTISAISVSDYPYQEYFFPKTEGFLTVPYNDISSMTSIVSTTPNVAAIFLEPIQGEGGIVVPDADYFRKVRELCDANNILLICDEIQTGMGRTGTDLCIDQYGIQADMILLGKSLGGGYLPVSGCISRKDVADVLNPGEHSSTFGGFPLGCRAALESLQYLHYSGILKRNEYRNNLFRDELMRLQTIFPHLINEVRGRGMLWGMQLNYCTADAWTVVNSLVNFGIVTREANNNVVRICPPLTSTDAELSFMFSQLEKCFQEIR